jgi:hypothetical protein
LPAKKAVPGSNFYKNDTGTGGIASRPVNPVTGHLHSLKLSPFSR